MKYWTALAVLRFNQKYFGPTLLVYCPKGLYTAALLLFELCTLLAASSIISYAVFTPTLHF